MLRFASDFVFFAQRPEVTDWLTPVWLLSVGIAAGFVLAILMLIKLAVLQKIPLFNSIDTKSTKYHVFSLLLAAFYVVLFLLYYRWQYGALTVDSDLVFTEGFKVDHRAQGASDEALDFLCAARLFACGGLAAIARMGGAREHAIFAGDPALARAAHPAGNLVGPACGAQDCVLPNLARQEPSA